MKRLIPLIMAAGLLIVLLVGFSPVAAPAAGPCLSPAAVAFTNGVMPMVVSVQCPPYYSWNRNKKCCACKQVPKCKPKGKCRCAKGFKWDAGKNRCVPK